MVNGAGCGRVVPIFPYVRVLEGKLDIAMMKLRIQTDQEDQSPGVNHAIAVPKFTLPDGSFLLYDTFSQDGFDLVDSNTALAGRGLGSYIHDKPVDSFDVS